MILKKLSVAAALAVPMIAAAQSVTLYGVIDTGLEYVNNIGGAKNSVFRQMASTGTVPSRWGLRGTEDLGGRLKSVFVLESGFTTDTGNAGQGGRLFGRQAYVGLSGPWGQVAFGRQVTMLYWANLDADILGPNIFGLASLDSYVSLDRADNMISYKGTFGGLTIGAGYSFGRDGVNAGPSPAGTNCAGENPADKRACREWSAVVLYENKWGGVSAAYDALSGGPGAFAGLTNSSLSDKRFSLSGYALLPRSKVGMGWLRRSNDGSSTPRSDLVYAGIAYDLTPSFTLSGQAYYIKYHNSYNKAFLYAIRGMYALSKRSSVYATAGYIDNGGKLAAAVDGVAGPNAGGSQIGAMIGIKHVF